MKKYCFIFFLALSAKAQLFAPKAIGIAYGFGDNNYKDYTYSNRFVKLQFLLNLKKTKLFDYEILVQPEVNFAQHQLLNLYFVKDTEADFETKRNDYTKLKNIREYALNIGFLVRKKIIKSTSIYAFGSVGPMITDTQTERLPKGFAFADLLGMGLSFQYQKMQFDVRPHYRHTSNANLGAYNAGVNTRNIEFVLCYML